MARNQRTMNECARMNAEAHESISTALKRARRRDCIGAKPAAKDARSIARNSVCPNKNQINFIARGLREVIALCPRLKLKPISIIR
jgi:hypothetical protein